MIIPAKNSFIGEVLLSSITFVGSGATPLLLEISFSGGIYESFNSVRSCLLSSFGDRFSGGVAGVSIRVSFFTVTIFGRFTSMSVAV